MPGGAVMALLVNPLTRYIGLGVLVAFGLLVAHDRRVDHLRGGYKAQLETVAKELANSLGEKVALSGVLPGVTRLAAARDTFKRERDNSRAVVYQQSASITALGVETERLRALSEKDRALAKVLIAQRDQWIERARAAETRTERRSAEIELEECNAALQELFDTGF